MGFVGGRGGGGTRGCGFPSGTWRGGEDRGHEDTRVSLRPGLEFFLFLVLVLILILLFVFDIEVYSVYGTPEGGPAGGAPASRARGGRGGGRGCELRASVRTVQGYILVVGEAAGRDPQLGAGGQAGELGRAGGGDGGVGEGRVGAVGVVVHGGCVQSAICPPVA